MHEPRDIGKCLSVRLSGPAIAAAFLGLMMLLAALAIIPYCSVKTRRGTPFADLQEEVHNLREQVEQLKQEQAMPAVMLNRYRNSIGYIYGVYHVRFANEPPRIRQRFSGTGFVVGDGLIATNRHVAEPWYKDPDAQALIDKGATPTLETLLIFFPGLPTAFQLSQVSVSKTSDIAILGAKDRESLHGLAVLPLAELSGPTGQVVMVVGYPMGITAMVAKAAGKVSERLAYRHNDLDEAKQLAAHSLIRPSAAYGHIGDVVADTLIYDAPTAHGGSGGPVLNQKGEVIGVNSGYMAGFSAMSFGVSVDSLRPLLKEAQRDSLAGMDSKHLSHSKVFYR